MTDEQIVDIVNDSIIYKCTNCGKSIDKEGTYITIHKKGQSILFCKDCHEKAIECMMDYYSDFVPLNPDYKPKVFPCTRKHCSREKRLACLSNPCPDFYEWKNK